MRTREQLIPKVLAYLERPNGNKIFMLPARMPDNLRHGDLYVYDGAICEFRLTELKLTREEADIAQDIWENGP